MTPGLKHGWNEIMNIMAMKVSRYLIAPIQAAPFKCIMADETTDAANKEQVVVCLWWVDNALEAHKDFIDLYEVESTEASAVLAIIRDVLKRLDIPMAKVRGQSFDGASAMSGSKAGVANQILEEQPKAIFTHCYGHSLNLACSDTIRQSQVIRNAFDTAHEKVNLVKKYPCREALLGRLKEELALPSPGIRLVAYPERVLQVLEHPPRPKLQPLVNDNVNTAWRLA